ncbi:MAG: hypothetical protein ACE5F1_05140 [Planctomycetota bacterium]
MARRTNDAVEAPIEILDEEGGPAMNMDVGIILTTTVLLLIAVILVMLALGGHYGAGPFK